LPLRLNGFQFCPHLGCNLHTSEEKFDIRSFVFACLEENQASTIESIQQRALSIGQSVSMGSISRYRKQYTENPAVTFNSSIEGDIEGDIETDIESDVESA
jgi:hypothetical protein